MARMLHIDSSPRGDRSHARRLTTQFVEAWKKAHPGDAIVYRDVGFGTPPHVDEAWIAAALTPPGERTSLMQRALRVSEGLVDEFVAADIYVCGVPMYNFTVPSSFNAYIDQIVRVGRTFSFDPEDPVRPYKPLLCGKKMFVIVAAGDSGYEEGGRYQQLNHVDPYLRTIFHFIGITDITLVHVGNAEFGGQKLADSVANAQAKLHLLAEG